MQGFSLLEIMVTVAIISIMAGSVVVGFNSFGQTVRVRETAGVISDTVRNLELEMIRREYDKQTLRFEEDFMLLESEVENQNLTLSWKGVGGSCPAGQGWMEIDNTGSPDTIFLAKRDQYDNNLEIIPIGAGVLSIYCENFSDSEENELRFQAFKGSDKSQVIRFKHFNIRRSDLSDPAEITAGTNYSLEISAPYGTKQFFNNGAPEMGTVELTLSTEDSSETITLQQ